MLEGNLGSGALIKIPDGLITKMPACMCVSQPSHHMKRCSLCLEARASLVLIVSV